MHPLGKRKSEWLPTAGCLQPVRNSLAAQKAHYENYIKSNDNWEFAGLYYDEGISGTKKEKRDGLLAMVAAC